MTQTTATVDERPLEQVTLPIIGMGCEGCVATVRSALSAVPGVENTVVDLNREQATVHFHPDVTSQADLIAAVKAAGYPVRR